MPELDPQTRSPISIKIQTKPARGGHYDCQVLNDKFPKLVVILNLKLPNMLSMSRLTVLARSAEAKYKQKKHLPVTFISTLTVIS